MFLDIDYSSNVLTNTFEQYTIATYSMEPLQNKTLDEMLEICRNLIFDFSYPFYTENEEAKADFEHMFILLHYKDNWGVETSGEFKFWLKNRLTLVMDEYKQLYKTMSYEYNPLQNHSLTRNIQRKGNETNEEKTTDTTSGNGSTANNIHVNGSHTEKSKNDNQNIHSDNPQVNFSGQDYASNMDRQQIETHVNDSSVSNTNGSTTHSQTLNSNGTSTDKKDFSNDEVMKESGYLGNIQDAINKERELIVNINRRLCEECKDLFFLLLP